MCKPLEKLSGEPSLGVEISNILLGESPIGFKNPIEYVTGEPPLWV